MQEKETRLDIDDVLNNNMRCFEIVKAMRTNDGLGMLNNNMRCFEIP